MSADTTDPTGRFSGRVAHYIRSRPGYPQVAIDTLCSETGFGEGSVVADVGSGTGILAGLLLARGATVHAVEPNQAMREAAERQLSGHPRFYSLDGNAEHTGLASGTIDLVCAAQAFHWFEPEAARKEFARILRPEGQVALLWNTWRSETPFMRAYEALIRRFGTDFSRVDHRNIEPDRIRAFLPVGYRHHRFANEQLFDLAGLRSRLLSSSFVPAPGETGHDVMLARLEEIFGAHQRKGWVRFLYTTELHLGK